jgi:hypothetical protein
MTHTNKLSRSSMGRACSNVDRIFERLAYFRRLGIEQLRLLVAEKLRNLRCQRPTMLTIVLTILANPRPIRVQGERDSPRIGNRHEAAQEE